VLTTSGDHESTVGHSLPPGRVLIVDDVPQIVELLRDSLTEQGYEVHTAVTGIEALNAVVPLQPDVIFSICRYPDCPG
jgi:two-component system KDP operon response regulator KdpE